MEESWIASANGANSGFTLDNLPFCAFETKSEAVHLGVGIGNLIVDLHVCAQAGLLNALPGNVRGACKEATLNRLMACGPKAVSVLRKTLREHLKLGVTRAEMDAVLAAVRSIEGAKFHKPVKSRTSRSFKLRSTTCDDLASSLSQSVRSGRAVNGYQSGLTEERQRWW